MKKITPKYEYYKSIENGVIYRQGSKGVDVFIEGVRRWIATGWVEVDFSPNLFEPLSEYEALHEDMFLQ